MRFGSVSHATWAAWLTDFAVTNRLVEVIGYSFQSRFTGVVNLNFEEIFSDC
jgi:hypothetical protein